MTQSPNDSFHAAYLYGRGVDIKLLEDGESLLVELAADCDVGNVWSVVVIEACDVVHHAGVVSLDGGQDQQVLQVPAHTDTVVTMPGTVCLAWCIKGHSNESLLDRVPPLLLYHTCY